MITLKNNLNNVKRVIPININKGINLVLIFIIIKKYKILKTKNIVIENMIIRRNMQYFFPKLKFINYVEHSPNNFYFNIRKIIKHQDIIIDYLNNYNDIINTKKIYLLPWYDNNDPIIVYEYNKMYNIYSLKWKNFIYNFSIHKRYFYKNKYIWDTYIEYKILCYYLQFIIRKNIILKFDKRLHQHQINKKILIIPSIVITPSYRQRIIKKINNISIPVSVPSYKTTQNETTHDNIDFINAVLYGMIVNKFKSLYNRL